MSHYYLLSHTGPGVVHCKLQRYGQAPAIELHSRPLSQPQGRSSADGAVRCVDHVQCPAVSEDPPRTHRCPDKVQCTISMMTHFYFLNAASKTRISCIGFFVFTLITSCQYTLLAYSYIAFCFQQLRPKISFLAGFLCLICLGIKVTIALLFIIIKIIFIFQNFIAIALTCCKIVYFCSRAQPSFRLRL